MRAGYGFGFRGALGIRGFGRSAAGAAPPAEFSPPLTVATYSGGTAALLAGYVPSSRNGSSWDDVGTGARHLTLTGSPATDDTGPMGAFLLDGVNDRGDWTGTAFSDTELTMFVVMKVESWPSAGAYEGILELSDTTGSDRSHWLYVYGSSNSVGLRTGNDVGAISFATSGSPPDPAFDGWLVLRVTVTANARSVWVNGTYRGSSAAIKTPRNITRIRIGNRLAGDVGYGNVKLASVLIYGGVMAEQACIDLEDDILERLSLAKPFDYSDIPVATNGTDPPDFSIVLGDVDVVAGMPLRVEKASLMAFNGRGVAPDTFDYDATYVEHPGHYVLTPPLGPSNLFLEKNGEAWITGFQGRELPTSGKRYLLILGDSNVNRMRIGLVPMLTRILGESLIECVGTVAAPTGYPGATTGYDSYVLASENVAGAAGAFLAPGSVLYAGGPSLNIPAFFASLTHTPTHVILACFQNAPYLADEANVNTALGYEKTAAQTILNAMGQAAPGLKVALMTEWPLIADPAAYGGSWSAREVYHRKMRRAAIAAQETVGGIVYASASAISTFPHVGIGTRPYSPWGDPVHLSPAGHEQLLPTTLGWLAAKW